MTEEEIKKNLGHGKDLRGIKFNKLTPLYPLKERKNVSLYGIVNVIVVMNVM